MTSQTIPLLSRVLAPAAALALLLSACGGSGDAPDGGEDTSAASSEEGGGPTTEENGDEAPGRAALGGPGILAADCSEGGQLGAALTLYSAEDGSALHSSIFSTVNVNHAVSEALSHGRAVETDTFSLPELCEGEPGVYFPERGMVVGTFVEVVNGNSVAGFGVLDENGTFTVLSPEQEVSDFATPTEYIHPVADPEGDRILFVEDNGEDTLPVQAMDMESGEITDVGTCDSRTCSQLTIIPGLEGAALGFLPFNDVIAVLGGSAVIASTGSGTLYFFDLGDHADANLIDFNEIADVNEAMGENTGPDSTPSVAVEGRGPITAIDDNSIVFGDNVLTVWEFMANTFTDYESDNADVLQYERPALPSARTLVPEGTRDNSAPHVSPDGTEIIFLSEPETGGASWYRVPVDGSSEPEEFPELPNHPTIISWT